MRQSSFYLFSFVLIGFILGHFLSSGFKSSDRYVHRFLLLLSISSLALGLCFRLNCCVSPARNPSISYRFLDPSITFPDSRFSFETFNYLYKKNVSLGDARAGAGADSLESARTIWRLFERIHERVHREESGHGAGGALR